MWQSRIYETLLQSQFHFEALDSPHYPSQHYAKNHFRFVAKRRHQRLRLSGQMREDAAEAFILEACKSLLFLPCKRNMYSDHVNDLIRFAALQGCVLDRFSFQ